MVEILAAFAKGKLAWLAWQRWPNVCIALIVWSGSLGTAYYGYQHQGVYDVQYLPAPTVPEMERHLENNDRRMDGIDGPEGKIDKLREEMAQNFKSLNEERAAQREKSDARYKENNDRVNALWYGISGIGILLGAGFLTPDSFFRRKITGKKSVQMSEEDMQQLATLMRAINQPKDPYRDPPPRRR